MRTIREYIAERRRNILQTIAYRLIQEDCRRAERWQGSTTRLYWLEQEVELDLSEEEEEGDVFAG